jgi:hypothetical protein
MTACYHGRVTEFQADLSARLRLFRLKRGRPVVVRKSAAIVMEEAAMSEKTPERSAPTPLEDIRNRVSAWLDALVRPPQPQLVPVRVRAR